jgi:hypothetical protein
MRFIANEYTDAVTEAFDPTKLVIAATLLKTNGGNVVTPDSLPAGLLFDKTTVRQEGTGYILTRDKKDIAYIESSEGQGSKWRYYNHSDKTKATMIYLLVTGDPEHDLCEVNLIVDVVKGVNTVVILPDGLIQFVNNTTINGRHWTDFQPNKTAQRVGFQYTLNNIQEPDSYSGLIYLPAGGRNFNQAGTQREYVNITTNPNTPISTDRESSTQFYTHADYCIKQSDLDDANIESFGITMVWLQGGNPKNASETMLIPIKDILL